MLAPCLDSVLKAFHTNNKDILTGEECSYCASKRFQWYQFTAILIATKPPDVIQQTLDVMREQFALDHHWMLKELRGILKGRQYSYRCVRRTAHGALILKWVLVVTWCVRKYLVPRNIRSPGPNISEILYKSSVVFLFV